MKNKKNNGEHDVSCSDCGFLNCYRQEKSFPEFCPGEAVEPDVLESVTSEYCGDADDARTARAAAEVEGLYYGKLTRVEEVLAFARRIGAHKIGLATCVGLIEETRIFSKILKRNGFEPYSVLCKIGSVDKSRIGLDDNLKIRPGTFEGMCNPILQARLLDKWGGGSQCDYRALCGARRAFQQTFRGTGDDTHRQGQGVGAQPCSRAVYQQLLLQ